MATWLTYIETHETRTLREAHNLQFGSVVPDDHLNEILLPTTAGTVLINIGQFTRSLPMATEDLINGINGERDRSDSLAASKAQQSSSPSIGRGYGRKQRTSHEKQAGRGGTPEHLALISPHTPPSPALSGVMTVPFSDDKVPRASNGTAEVCAPGASACPPAVAHRI